jgi:capsular polysaccharide biosynthesis protein
LSFSRQLRIFWHWLGLIVASTVAGALVAGVITSQIAPTYEATVRLISGPTLTGTIDNGDIVAGANLASTYAELATTRAILREAITTTKAPMSVDDLQKSISTHVPVNSGLLTITVDADDAKLAANLANAIAAQLVSYPATPPAARPSSNVQLTVIDPAVAPETPTGPRVLFNAGLGAAIGFVLSASIAFLIENARRPESDEEELVTSRA